MSSEEVVGECVEDTKKKLSSWSYPTYLQL